MYGFANEQTCSAVGRLSEIWGAAVNVGRPDCKQEWEKHLPADSAALPSLPPPVGVEYAVLVPSVADNPASCEKTE